MFVCDKCKEVTALMEPCNRLVVETRPKVYRVVKIIENFKDEGVKTEKVTETTGTEIVKELRLCSLCYAKSKNE